MTPSRLTKSLRPRFLQVGLDRHGGIKKEYRFLKGVRGTAFILFNLYDPKHKSPYGDVMNSRFGFEFPLKKKRSEPLESE